MAARQKWDVIETTTGWKIINTTTKEVHGTCPTQREALDALGNLRNQKAPETIEARRKHVRGKRTPTNVTQPRHRFYNQE